jgi:hypothetical protein
METTSRTVRFKLEEMKLIEEFLRENPFFDFSSLTRTAIMQFVKNPKLVVRPVTEVKTSKDATKSPKDH